MGPFDPRHRHLSRSGQAAIALYRITQATAGILRSRGDQAARGRLSSAQIQALLFLRFARPGVRTIGGLAGRLGATHATASGVADALERKRLVRRSPLPEDQRTITLSLTPAGAREAAQLEDVLDEVVAAVAALPEADQQALAQAAQAVVRRLQAAGRVRVYEMCWGCQFFRRDAHPADPAGPHHCAFVDAPLPEPNTYLECPDFIPLEAA